MKKQLKNQTAFGAKLKKMSKEVYALRRKIIDSIYHLKNLGYELPRIEVRVVEGTKGATAYALYGKNIIHVDEKWIDENILIRTMHEIGHAVFSLKRIKGDLLMDCNDWSRYRVDQEKVFECFDKHYKKHRKGMKK